MVAIGAGTFLTGNMNLLSAYTTLKSFYEFGSDAKEAARTMSEFFTTRNIMRKQNIKTSTQNLLNNLGSEMNKPPISGEELQAMFGEISGERLPTITTLSHSADALNTYSKTPVDAIVYQKIPFAGIKIGIADSIAALQDDIVEIPESTLKIKGENIEDNLEEVGDHPDISDSINRMELGIEGIVSIVNDISVAGAGRIRRIFGTDLANMKWLLKDALNKLNLKNKANLDLNTKLILTYNDIDISTSENMERTLEAISNDEKYGGPGGNFLIEYISSITEGDVDLDGFNHIKKYFEYLFKGNLDKFFPTDTDKASLDRFYTEILRPYTYRFLAEFGFSDTGASPENYEDISVDRVKEVFKALLEMDFIENSDIQDLIKGDPKAWRESIQNYFKLFFEVSFTGSENIDKLKETFADGVEFTIIDMIMREYIGIDQINFIDKAHLTSRRLEHFMNNYLGIKNYFEKEFLGPKGLVRFFESFRATRFQAPTSQKFSVQSHPKTFHSKYLEADICYNELPLILANAFKESGSKEFSFYDSASLNPHGVLRNFNQFILGENADNRKLISIYEYMFNGINFYADEKYSQTESLTEQDIGTFLLADQVIRFESKHTWDKSFESYTPIIDTAIRQITSSQYLDFLQALNYRIEQGSKDSDKSFISNYLFSPYFKIYEDEDNSIELVLLDVIEHLSKINQFKDLEAGIPKPNILFESIAQLINSEIKKMTFDSTLSREEIVEKIQEKIEDLFANQIDPNFKSTVRKLYKNILGTRISDDDIDILYNEIKYDFLEEVERYIRKSPDFTDSEYEIVFDNNIRMHYDSGQSLTRSMLLDVCFIVVDGVKRDLGPTDPIPQKALKIVHDEDGNFGILVEDTVNDLPSDIYEGYKDPDGYIHKNIYVQNEDGNYLISDLNLETMEVRNEGWQKILFAQDNSGCIKKEDAVRYFLAFSRNTGSRHTSDIREVITHIRPKEFFKEYAPGLKVQLEQSEKSDSLNIIAKRYEDLPRRSKIRIQVDMINRFTEEILLAIQKRKIFTELTTTPEFFQFLSRDDIDYDDNYFKSVLTDLELTQENLDNINCYKIVANDFKLNDWLGKGNEKVFYNTFLKAIQSHRGLYEGDPVFETILDETLFDDPINPPGDYNSPIPNENEAILMKKIDAALDKLFGFSGHLLLQIGLMVFEKVGDTYEICRPIPRRNDLLKIFQTRRISYLGTPLSDLTDYSYSDSYFQRNTLRLIMSRLLFLGRRKVLRLDSGEIFIIKSQPSYELHSKIFSNIDIYNAKDYLFILGNGYIRLDHRTHQISPTCLYKSIDIDTSKGLSLAFFKSSNNIMRELYKLIHPLQEQGLVTSERERDVLEKTVWYLTRTDLKGVRKDIEHKMSNKLTGKIDIEIDEYTSQLIYINDINIFLRTGIQVFGDIHKPLRQGYFDEYVLGVIKNMLNDYQGFEKYSSYQEYIENNGDEELYKWFMQEEFYLFWENLVFIDLYIRDKIF